MQAVFEKASEVLGFDVTPHFLRHTGASQMLWFYCQKNKIVLDVNQSTTIHVWLKNQLGHVSIETTEHYIRTVMRLEAEDIVSVILPMALPTSMENMGLSGEHIDAMERAIEQNKQFFIGIDYDEK